MEYITSELIVKIFGAGGVAGVVLSLLNFLLKNRSLDQQGYSKLQSSWITEITRLQDQQVHLMEQIQEWERKYNNLSRRVEILKAELYISKKTYPDIPLPMFLEDTVGNIISVNNTFEQIFLLPEEYSKDDIMGYGLEVIFGDKVNEIINKVKPIIREFKHPYPVRFNEMKDCSENVLCGWTLYIYPRYYDGVFVGAGYVGIPVESDNYVNK